MGALETGGLAAVGLAIPATAPPVALPPFPESPDGLLPCLNTAAPEGQPTPFAVSLKFCIVTMSALFCAVIEAGSVPSGKDNWMPKALPAATYWFKRSINGWRSGGQKQGMTAPALPRQLPACWGAGIPRVTPKSGTSASLTARRRRARGAAQTIVASAKRT